MDSIDLKTFEAVARAGGITHAARELNTVQSNVTARIQRLERELGVALFHRHSRGVTLTDSGRELLPFATNARALLAEAKRAITEKSEPCSPLLIGSLESTAAVRLPPILVSYARSYPQVDVTVLTGTSDELVEGVLSGKWDGAFVLGPVTNPDLVAVPVVEEELVLVTPYDVHDVYAWLREATSPKALVFRLGCAYRRRFEALLADEGVVNVRWLEFGTLEGIVGCVSAGLGITLLPRTTVEAPRRGRRVAIHRVPREYARAKIVFVRRRDGFTSLSLRRFAECASKQRWPAKGGAMTRPAATAVAARGRAP